MDPQQTSQGRPHVFYFVILFYPKSHIVNSLIDMSCFTTSINIIFDLPLPFSVPSKY